MQNIHKIGIIKQKFGKDLPIILYDLEYYEKIVTINIKANGDILPCEFLEFISE